MWWRIALTLTSLSVTIVTALVLVAASTPDVEPRLPGERDRCPVCGMFVAPHPEWLAQVVFEDGSRAWFDGAKDLFTYLLSRDRYLEAARRLGIAEVFVSDYYEGESIPARTAWFVVGSDVLGPMGNELVAHASREAAEEFLRDHGGRQVVAFEQVTRSLLHLLR